MGWGNPPVSWTELARRLADRPVGRTHADRHTPPGAERFPGADGGDSPAWSHKRLPYEPRPLRRATATVPYAELHCHSNFSFLDGASHPEELVEEAVALGLEALALTDHNGFYGVVRFAEAARAQGLPTVFGAELTLGARDEVGVPDPAGEHLLVLARDPIGYGRLARVISEAQLAGSKGAPQVSLDRLTELGGVGTGDHWAILTGCRKGSVPAALADRGPTAARRRLDDLVGRFGRDHVAVELWDHGHPVDSARNDALTSLAIAAGVDLVATNNVHYANPTRRQLATALAAVRSRRSLDEVDGWLPAGAGAHLRSGAEQARRFARYPGVIERAVELARASAFDLKLVAPELPDYVETARGWGRPIAAHHSEMTYLRQVTEEGAALRYGPRPGPAAPGAIDSTDTARRRKAYTQIDHELDLIEQLNFPGYFLVVWDIVEFCRKADIYCQGRGSAANSAVCYALGITKADAVDLDLLFERFLSPERDGPPDIDLDIESGRREEAIQYVYDRYGRHNTAQVANVITYRARSSVRDMAKALGYATGQQDAWSKQIDRWSHVADSERQTDEQGRPDHDIPEPVLALAAEVEHFPRHLGIHSGGMVICDRPVVEVCPVEWARMEDRSVLQWDKDDCAAVGLVKFDLLGLGMLTALHGAVDLIRDHHGVEVDIATIPQDIAVYDMLCEADSIGVFQVESRAQMATLPRLRPRHFYDLVVEVALIRPGPIQGGSVHPYIRRRNGEEPVTYLHPLLEGALAKTLGIPLFQEQLMQMAIDVAGFSPGEADELRQAMGSKRSLERMGRLRARFYDGMAERGITGDVADQIWLKLQAFANYGFPESHSVSFAYLVYASSWIKRYYPAAFTAALLNAQPMGFYSPHSLVQDAVRHGVEVRTPDINHSKADATLEPCESSTGGVAIRLGISSVRGIGDDLAEAIEAGSPYESMEALRRETGASLEVLEALATAGAFGSLGLDRREALWVAGAVAQSGDERLAGVVTGDRPPRLPGMEPEEEAIADLWATGVSPDGHPTRFLREQLDAAGVVSAKGLRDEPAETRVLVAGVVTHRQRPATAGGTTFINLEDETGLINVIVSRGCWARHRRAAQGAPALLIRGRLERGDGDVINIVAERLDPLPLRQGNLRSRDFR
ncbi:MAG: error-prone DNA polymerase [Actinomycetota bacterium]|nr:error-prone DNA polymerase [Actinomycetota bacterium]